MSTIDKNQVVEDQIKIPVELCKRDSDLFVVLLTLPRSYFREPFFIDSLARSFSILEAEIKLPEEDELLARPVHYGETDKRVVYIQIDEFIKRYSGIEIDKKLGFIFHMSRCGSTLATQMLASSDRFFVLSEPTIINAVLDPALNITPEKRKLLLKATIHALVICSPLTCEQVFIKFRSWNIFYLDFILKEFLYTKWLFIHRDGLEVMSSVFQKPPGWLRSRKIYGKYFCNLLGISEETLQKISYDEYTARILGTFCQIAKSTDSKLGLFLDYDDLKNKFMSVVNRVWGIESTDKEKQIMDDTSRLYSKDVNKMAEFKSDSEEKRKAATNEQREYSDRYIEVVRKALTNE